MVERRFNILTNCYVFFSYQQHFDMEGESGIVVRGIGTAVMITKITSLKYPLKIATEYVLVCHLFIYSLFVY